MPLLFANLPRQVFSRQGPYDSDVEVVALSMQAAKALVRLRICTDSSDHPNFYKLSQFLFVYAHAFVFFLNYSAPLTVILLQ